MKKFRNAFVALAILAAPVGASIVAAPPAAAACFHIAHYMANPTPGQDASAWREYDYSTWRALHAYAGWHFYVWYSTAGAC